MRGQSTRRGFRGGPRLALRSRMPFPRSVRSLLVAALWLVAAVVLLPFAAKVEERLEVQARIPDSESAQVEEALRIRFASPFAVSALCVIGGAPPPSSPEGRRVLEDDRPRPRGRSRASPARSPGWISRTRASWAGTAGGPSSWWASIPPRAGWTGWCPTLRLGSRPGRGAPGSGGARASPSASPAKARSTTTSGAAAPTTCASPSAAPCP